MKTLKNIPYTVSMELVRGIVQSIARNGHAPQPFLLKAGIAPQLLEQPGARVSSDQYVALMWHVITTLNDEALGLFTRPLKRGSLELIARVASAEHTAQRALERMCEVHNLLQDDVEVSLQLRAEEAAICVRSLGSRPQANFLYEYLLRILWRVSSWLMGGGLRVRRFDFAFAQPDYARDYGEAFPAPMRFGQAVSAFWFESGLLRRACRRDESALRSFVASWPAAAVIPARAANGIANLVHAHLQQRRPVWDGLEATAAALHMSAPTLQRKLSAAGTSFQAIKDGMRRDIAISRLGSSTVSFATLAADLGFADAAAFQRAFKGWTGSPPGLYRARAP
ncbi:MULTISPECIES: AraC family transcriptional regulator [Comamonas]|jgi:AraC-like DNA-binding protein|uniref:AraC family transcriptional regulator n=1 Tax=Comamonas TaxID=283 RepID=UPI0012CD5EE6|nr:MULTISPECIES: AraC family transcriptional regulator [Comamonas]MDR3065505.1 AraC family transcriptional regulator [Comamonas sp.]MEB5964769.1 AraC family transcriptional regulator [Comamonas testosteroni]MPS95967.1 AraC family transcriptional regulator [Comamonas sp.]